MRLTESALSLLSLTVRYYRNLAIRHSQLQTDCNGLIGLMVEL